MNYCIILIILLFIFYGNGEITAENKAINIDTNNTLRVPNKFTKERLNTIELVQECGLVCEVIEATSEDGYILKLFHIINPNITQEMPILLLHGFLDSSDTFCLRRNSSPAIYLTKAGYDVWLGNMRGNRYSRRHITLNADIDRNYWNFTYHENGYYDYPAIIDKVLSRTDKKQLIVIGHSQGTLNYFVMGSTRPDYNDKVKLFIALAPIFYSRNNRGVAALAPLVLPLAYKVLKALDQVELLGQNSLLVKALQEMCTKFKQSYKVCIHGLLFSVFGVDEDQIELEFVPIIMKQYFAGGASVKTIAHANQFTHGHYGQLDYGVRNMEMYGSLTAPLYNLTNISTKVVLMVGRNDFVATVSDTMKLLDALPNATYFEMPRNLFSHMDFVWSNQMPKYLFPYLHKFLDEYQ